MMLTSEEKRLKALHSYNLMDTEAEKQYDHITRLACYICGTKMAAINLIDDSRLWIKSKVGLDICEFSKDLAICKYTMQQHQLLEIPDTQLDARMKDSLVVSGENGLRFYAGISLVTPEGYTIGTICVFDTKPNLLNESQKEALQFLADETVLHMETTKRNLELQALTVKQNEFKALFNNSGDLHFISDEKGKIEFINSSVEEILGYQAEEVIGRSILDFCVPDDQHIIKKMQESLLCGEDKVEFLVRIIAKNQEIKWFSFFNVNLNNRWLSNGRDLTKHILAEQELQQLSLVASHVTNGVVINDENNKILWVNKAFETLTGYNLKDVKGERLSHILPGKQTDSQILDYAEKKVSNKSSFTIELLAYTKKQEQIWLSVVNSVILNELGDVSRSIEIIKDITERKQTELDLQILSAVVTKSDVGVLIRNAKNEVIWQNKATEKILGWTLDELKGTVLVADDNQINLTLAKKILSKWGIEADVAANGLEAYEMAVVKDYNLILMDLHMPVMDGLEATKLIRKQPHEKYKTIPIIALTGSVFGLDLENLQQEGLTDHFLKPYTPEGLYNKIKPYLKPAIIFQQ